MEESLMKNRRELEGRIVLELRTLKSLESKLNQRFAGLAAASSTARISFMAGLMNLAERTRKLEELVDSLSDGIQWISLNETMTLGKERNNVANAAHDYLGHHADRRVAGMAV
jgi:hypothetical protein